MSSRFQRPIRFGIIGCGVIAKLHAEAIARCPEAELIAVSDVIAERAQTFAQTHGVGIALADNRALLAMPEVDVVNVCVPSGLHATVTIEAVQAGKHVLCEKPLDIRKDRMAAMIQAAKVGGVQLGAVYQRRMAPMVTQVKVALDQGQLGTLVLADAMLKYHRSTAYYESGDWRGTWEWDGGGALMNQGVHGVDLLQWLVGDIVTVSARTKTLTHDIPVEDTAVATVEFAHGALGVIAGATSVYPELPTRLSIHGDEGSLVFGDHGVEHWTMERRNLTEEMAKTPVFDFAHAHQPFIDNMVAVARGEGSVLVSGESARQAVDVILAIYESARTGQPVTVTHGED
ncbi:MAG: Gfo/Idh/MocA family oxidoreductase [Firmicutes bacterium]|nr:Gfo/Idh/MocA family oxidoreductase [Bacillota bacterium]